MIVTMEKQIQTELDYLYSLNQSIDKRIEILEGKVKQNDISEEVSDKPEKEKEKTKRKPTGIAEPMYISKQLSKFLDVPENKMLARTELTSLFAKYIKENNLGQGKEFKPDQKLRKLLGPPIYPISSKHPNTLGYTYSNLQKYLTKHLKKATK